MAKGTRPGMMLYFDDLEALYRLDNAQLGALIRAMTVYARQGQAAELDDPMVDMAFSMFKYKLDRDKAHYEEISNRRTIAAQRSRMARREPEAPTEQIEQMQHLQPTATATETATTTETATGTDVPKEKRPRFSPPSPEEVRIYAVEMGYEGFNAETFVNYYAANGWRVGRNPMKDWKAAVRSWHTRDKPGAAKASSAAVQKEYRDFNPATDW